MGVGYGKYYWYISSIRVGEAVHTGINENDGLTSLVLEYLRPWDEKSKLQTN